jgi:hypothetical protein
VATHPDLRFREDGPGCATPMRADQGPNRRSQ